MIYNNSIVILIDNPLGLLFFSNVFSLLMLKFISSFDSDKLLLFFSFLNTIFVLYLNYVSYKDKRIVFINFNNIQFK
jgi:hypothetical protein